MLTVAYIVGLSLIGILTIATHAFIDSLLKVEAGAARVAAVADRQQFLSQRIAWLVRRYADADGDAAGGKPRDELAQEIGRLVAQMRRNHERLRDGRVADGVPGTRAAEIDAIFFGEPFMLDQRIETFLASVESVLAMPGGLDVTQPRLRAVEAAADSALMSALDASGDAFVRLSEARVHGLRRLLLTFLVAILALLVAEALLLFRPNVRRVQRIQQRLHDLAHSDPLTGCLNRRTLFHVAEDAFASWRRSGRAKCLLALDIDRFKSINDTYGHSVGDEVIREVVRRALAELREVDHFGRIGGEEFVALLDREDVAEATGTAERIRARLKAVPVEANGNSIAVTASFGVARFEECDRDALACLDRADRALYAAKNAGRDCVKAG